MRPVALGLAMALSACATVREERGVAGGARGSATIPGATVYRYVPTAAALATGGGPRVLVVPELGFDEALVAPLCERLQRAGFDVLSVEPDSALASFADWELAVARAARLHGGHPRVLAIGAGGAAAWTLARAGGASGVVAVNVPVRRGVGNVAFAEALAADLYDPEAWAAHGKARILLGGGRSTPDAEVDAIADRTRGLAEGLKRELAFMFSRPAPITLPDVPIRVLASVKDNVVEPEWAFMFPDGAKPPVAARRLARVELFARDYGHLDWLASDAALDDVAPVLAAELEALP